MNTQEYTTYHENKEHGVPNFPYNTYLCTIPLDFKEVKLHWHEEMELIYLKKGCGRISVDLRDYDLCAPAIVMILPGQLHAIRQSGTDTMEYENIIFHPDMLITRQADVSMSDFLLPLLQGQLVIPAAYTSDSPHFAEVAAPIDACDEIGKTRPLGYELYIKGKLFEFFYILDSRCRDLTAAPRNSQYLAPLKPVLKLVEEHYAEKLTIEQAADAAGFSSSHFMRYFKDVMHCTFISYLNDYRLDIAASRLAASDASILEIAESSGFFNLSHFNRTFLKKYGVTPREYKKKA